MCVYEKTFNDAGEKKKFNITDDCRLQGVVKIN